MNSSKERAEKVQGGNEEALKVIQKYKLFLLNTH